MTRLLVALTLAASAAIAFAQATGGNGVPGGPGGSASLPVGAIGQTLFNSTGSSTYVAATNPGLLNFPNYATANNPLYLEAHFRDDTQQAFLSYSADAQNYVQLDATPLPVGYPTGGVRDIGFVYVPATATFYFSGTCCNNTTFAYWTSTNLQTFSAVTLETAPGVGIYNFSPHIFLDTHSGNYYAVIGGCATSCSNPNTFFLATFTPSTGVFGTWANITPSGASTDIFDCRIYWDAANSTYYMIYTNDNGPSQQYIAQATATAIGGPYTQTYTLTTDHFGLGPAAENPDIIPLPNGNVRIQADVFVLEPNTYRWYSREYVDTSTNFTVNVTTPQLINGPEQEGGTNMTITSPAVAAIVYNAAEIQPNPVNFPLAKIGVNGAQNSAYSIFFNNFASSAYPNAFNATAPPAIGFQGSGGSVASLSPNGTGGVLCVGAYPGDCSGGLQTPTFSTAGNFSATFLGAGGQTQAGFVIDETAQTSGKKWQEGVQAGARYYYDVTDNTVPFALIPTPTTFANLAKIGSLSQWCWEPTAQYANTSNTCDTGQSRFAANVIAFGNGTQGNASALILAGNTSRVTSPITLSASATTIFSWSLPAVAQSWAFVCHIPYAITAGTTPTINLSMNASQAPSNETAYASINSTNTGTSTQGNATSAASGNVSVLTGASVSNGTYQSQITGTVTASATAGTFAIAATLGGTTPAGTIPIGATCTLQ